MAGKGQGSGPHWVVAQAELFHWYGFMRCTAFSLPEWPRM